MLLLTNLWKRQQLNKMFEFEEAALIDPDQEQMNKVFKFRDPKPKQLNEISEVKGASQIVPEQ